MGMRDDAFARYSHPHVETVYRNRNFEIQGAEDEPLSLQARFTLEQFFYPDTRFRLSAENRSNFLFIEMFKIGRYRLAAAAEKISLLLPVQAHFSCKTRPFPDFRFFRRLDIHVNENWTG